MNRPVPTDPKKSRLWAVGTVLAVPLMVAVYLQGVPEDPRAQGSLDEAILRVAHAEAQVGADFAVKPETQQARLSLEGRLEDLRQAVTIVSSTARDFVGDEERDVRAALADCFSAVDTWDKALVAGAGGTQSLPVTHAAERLHTACARVFAQRHTVGLRWRSTAYAMGGALICLLASAFFRARRTERELDQALTQLDEELAESMEIIEIREADLERALESGGQRDRDASEAQLAASEAIQSREQLLMDIERHLMRSKGSAHAAARSAKDGSVETNNDEDLADVLGSLVDLHRIRASELQVDYQKTSLLELMTSVQDSVEPRARAKSLKFRVVYRGCVPEWIETDTERLRRVLKTLLSHAIETTEAGRVEVILLRLTRTGESGHLQFTVRDTGPGMSQSDLDALFSMPADGLPFDDVDTPPTRLGLYCVQKLIAHMGGTFSAESLIGRGTTIVFSVDCGTVQGEVPAEKREKVDESAENRRRAPLAGRRVLLAEDGLDNQRLMRYLLQKVGAEGVIVENGELAVQTALAAEAEGRPFDVVLMDMQMPIMDGYQASMELRSRGYDRPILALTAFALPTDRDKCLSAGCDEFLTKPIDHDRFIETLLRAAGPGESTPSGMSIDSPLERHMEEPSDQNEDVNAEGTPSENEPVHEPEETEPVGEPLFSNFNDDEDMLELIEWFVRDLKQDIVKIEQAFATGDVEGLRVLSHQLKGSAGSYGFPTITEEAERLESCVRDPDPPREELGAIVKTFVALCSRVAVAS